MIPTQLQEYRREHVPLYNANKMKLGVFGTNVSGGGTMTFAETSFTPTYKHNVEIAKKADALGFEMFIPFARWKSLGGESEYTGGTARRIVTSRYEDEASCEDRL
jgi:hypothetical protein